MLMDEVQKLALQVSEMGGIVIFCTTNYSASQKIEIPRQAPKPPAEESFTLAVIGRDEPSYRKVNGLPPIPEPPAETRTLTRQQRDAILERHPVLMTGDPGDPGIGPPVGLSEHLVDDR